MAKIMTKIQVIKLISDETNLSRAQVSNVMTHLDQLAKKEIKKTGQFRILDLGKLKIKHSKARVGRNPVTGQSIKIPAKIRIKFVASKAIKDLV